MTSNRLAAETSPYLLQHRDNPVHWWAWGSDAIDEARRTGKPILLSIGYAACHWCHVMAHESFENPSIAGLMNELFINIKVDREERPDIDAIYMAALHELGEQGGWPLTMFLDSDARPFWGGTYFPPDDRWGRPSFPRVLREVARIHSQEPERVAQNADAITTRLNTVPTQDPAAPDFTEPMIAEIIPRIIALVDLEHGGMRGAPKFPQTSFFWFLWRAGLRFDDAKARQAVEVTLRNICQGGIYDHLGGGFARYSVDERWLAPHFEKMLYDNALLIDLMTEVWREGRDPLFQTRIRETVDWLFREMTTAEGGFAASLDADSEGVEGKFYVWQSAEIEAVLRAEDAAFFGSIYDVTHAGNWEHSTILNRLNAMAMLSQDEERALADMRVKLLTARSARIRPGYDDKVLADWNGLMISALARAGAVFKETVWIEAARRAYDFVRNQMQSGGRLVHSYRSGQAKAPATAADYANMIRAAITLHQVAPDPALLEDATNWCTVMRTHYWIAEAGGYAFSADDTADVILRTRKALDDATPNANATMAVNLMQLSLLTGNSELIAEAEAVLRAFRSDIGRNLVGHMGMLDAVLTSLAPMHVVVAGAADDAAASAMREAVNGCSLPGAVVEFVADATDIAAKTVLGRTIEPASEPTAYICVGPQCSLPITEPQAFADALRLNRLR